MIKQIAILIALTTRVALAETQLTEPQLFLRCYAQLTQTSLDPQSSLLLPVQNGTKTAAQACLEIFDRGSLTTGGTTLVNRQNAVSLAVLNTLHRLHASWFSEREYFVSGAGPANQGLRDYFDTDSPAFFFTRAVFRPNTDFKTVLTGTKHLRAIRSDNDPLKGIASNNTKAQTIFGDKAKFAAIGALQGIEETGTLPTNYSFLTSNDRQLTGTVNLGAHYGGGVLGSFPYLMLNVRSDRNFRSDGAVEMPRKWARAVFSDLLCRSLPVARYADVGVYKNSASPVAFRKSQGCVQCHTSMDQMAAVVRGFRYLALDSGSRPESRGLDTGSVAPPQAGLASESEWPTKSDSSYHLRPPKGVLFYRDATGALINLPVNDLADLGDTMARLPDFYLCAAKRYYAYFTGVDVAIEDPVVEGQTSRTDKFHRAAVERLATTLQTTQSARATIFQLFQLPQYRSSSFKAER